MLVFIIHHPNNKERLRIMNLKIEFEWKAKMNGPLKGSTVKSKALKRSGSGSADLDRAQKR